MRVHPKSSWRFYRQRDSSVPVDRTLGKTMIRIYASNRPVGSFWPAGVAVTIALVLALTASGAKSSTRPRPLTAGAVSFVVPAGWYGKIFGRAPQGYVL